MKTSSLILPALVATSSLAVTTMHCPHEDTFLDHLTLSARFGFGIEARFGARVNQSGGTYNSLDGYVLTDSTGNFSPPPTNPSDPHLDNLTQYWGYDNSARQRDGAPVVGGFPTVLMTRIAGAAAGGGLGGSTLEDDPTISPELSYRRQFAEGDEKDWSWGGEIAVNYQNLCLRNSGTQNYTGVQDAFQYYQGTLPPNSPTSNGQSYQGPYAPSTGGPQYILISPLPIPQTGTVPVVVSGRHQFDADIWGFRLGPYLNRTLGKEKNWDVNFVGGLALALVDSSVSWSEDLRVNGIADSLRSGSGGDTELMWGYYVGANVSWHINKRWDLNAGVQFQDLGTLQQNVGNRQVELDMSEVIYLTVGVAYKF